MLVYYSTYLVFFFYANKILKILNILMCYLEEFVKENILFSPILCHTWKILIA